MTEQEMAQRQAAAMHQAQAMSAMGQSINPALLQNAAQTWSRRGIENAAYLRIEPRWGLGNVPREPTQWEQDYEEAMQELDEIAPGYRE